MSKPYDRDLFDDAIESLITLVNYAEMEEIDKVCLRNDIRWLEHLREEAF